MKRTAILLGGLLGLLSAGLNLVLGRDLLTVATRSTVVTLLGAIIVLLALRAVARVIVRQVQAPAQNLRKPAARPSPTKQSTGS